MSAKNDGSRFAAFLRLNQRLEKLHKQHPVLFNLIAPAIALILFGAALLIKWMLQ